MNDQEWLEQFLQFQGGVAGTVHRRHAQMLTATAQVNIPESVQTIIAKIPDGKGMAGLAVTRRAPTVTCDLSSDATGDVLPGARSVNAQAAIALPVFDDSSTVYAVVGIAFAHDQPLSKATIDTLSKTAHGLPEAHS